MLNHRYCYPQTIQSIPQDRKYWLLQHRSRYHCQVDYHRQNHRLSHERNQVHAMNNQPRSSKHVFACCTCLNARSVTRFALQVTSNYSKIFSKCGVDLYTGNTFNDAISCLKVRIDLYTRSTYTRVYTVLMSREYRESMFAARIKISQNLHK